MNKVLVIDDYPESCHSIQEAIGHSYDFDVVESASQAMSLAGLDQYCAFLIDLNLPETKGDKLIEKLRKEVGGPAAFYLMTSADFDYSIVNYHSYLIDDFLKKDSSKAEIASRFNATFERVKFFSKILEHKVFKIDLAQARVFVRDVEIDCTSIEYRILCNLLNSLKEISYVPKDIFIKNVWGKISVEDKTISTHLSNLNKKLSKHGVRVKTKRFKGLFVEAF